MDDLLDTAPCGFLSFNDDGSIEQVNRTLQEWLGYAPADLHGRHVDLILPAGSRIFYQTHFFPLLHLQGAVEEVYFPLRARDGSSIPMLVNAARRERAGVSCYDCVLMRVPQRDRFENEILRAKTQAEEARRAKDEAYAELETFASSVSHDLRTPLLNIQMFTRFIQKDTAGKLDPQVDEYLAYIVESASEMSRMIGDILAYSRTTLSTLELEPVSLGEAVSHAEDQMRAELAQRDVQLERIEPLRSVRAHRAMLNQSVANLLANAVKFVQPGVQPRVRIWSELLPGAQPAVRLWVADNGIGVAPEDHERIFRLFDRGSVKDEYSGSGLGLAIVRKAIERMGGRIGLESAPGAGSRFWLELPAAE